MTNTPATPECVKVILYSDDSATRRKVIEAVGRRAGAGLPKIEWIESATSAGFIAKYEEHEPSLLVLDGEAAKEGGMSLSRRVHVEYDNVPPVAVICARPQDHWLATWSKADAVIDEPIDPRKVQETVACLLTDYLAK